MAGIAGSEFEPELHKQFLLRSLDVLPDGFEIYDTSRLPLLYFVVFGLDVLDGLDSLTDDRRKGIIEWVYGLQLVPGDNCPVHMCGFVGSTTFVSLKNHPACEKYYESDVCMTYMALCILITLGDDLSRVNRSAILQRVASLQKPDGSFKTSYDSCESDLRFVYCSLAVCNILNDLSNVNVNSAVKFISNCFNYDGAFGQKPGAESHGGFTYCAIASLSLLGELNNVLDEKKFKTLERWAVNRQSDSGFQGRPGKDADTCYSFWLGATLSTIESLQIINKKKNRDFILDNGDTSTGGFCKDMDSLPDPLHTCLSLCALSLIGEEKLNPINPEINITVRAANHLKQIKRTNYM